MLLMNKLRQNISGIAAIEFAIIMPILFLLILGGVEVGYYIYKKQVLSRTVTITASAIQANPHIEIETSQDPETGEDITTILARAKDLAYASGGGTIPYGTDGHYVCAKAYDPNVTNSVTCSAGEWDTERPDSVR